MDEMISLGIYSSDPYFSVCEGCGAVYSYYSYYPCIPSRGDVIRTWCICGEYLREFSCNGGKTNLTVPVYRLCPQ